jgi:AraC-like DNA-binding protein
MIDLRTFTEYPNVSIPRRIMRYVLVWCSRGQVKVVIDDKELTLMENQVVTITSGQYHCLKDINHGFGLILEFTLDYICKDDRDIELIFHNGLFCHFDLNEVIPVDNAGFINDQLVAIKNEMKNKPYQYLTSIHARIELMLVEINRAKVVRGDEIYKPDALFLKFLEMVRGNFENNYPLKKYAIALGTTELKLNELAKLHTGKTAQSVIHGLIASEAKRLLLYQDFSIKEVAFKLGFNDQFYFSNFFKKYTGQSPKYYQEQSSHPA